MTDLVEISASNGVMEIVWNRPDKKNALSNLMYRAATAALARAVDDRSIRVVLLASEGDSFTSGNDLADFASAATGGEAPAAGAFIEAIIQFPKPLVAAVPGLAVGVGTTMLLHCDLVFVAQDAKLTTPFVNLALVPEAASSLIAPRLMGHARAFEMLVMGRPLSPEQAVAAGIASRVVAPEEIEAAGFAAAAEIAAKPREAVKLSRRLLKGSPDEILTRIDEEARLFAQRLRSAEAQKAFMAFLNKAG